MKSLVSTNLLMREDHFLCSDVELCKTLAATENFDLFHIIFMSLLPDEDTPPLLCYNWYLQQALSG